MDAEIGFHCREGSLYMPAVELVLVGLHRGSKFVIPTCHTKIVFVETEYPNHGSYDALFSL
eukprot:scaffold124235_cov22-Cyclotella_meneghiniana.AAC.2